LRGLRTLGPRLAAHQANATALAELLIENNAVEKVYFPGLSRHPGHLLARRQQRGFGAMLSFDLAGGEAAAAAFVTGLECFTLAESLGGVESLVAHPATMTHASMDADARSRAGIGDGLLRLSVGIEALDDLRADIERGLRRATLAERACAA
jgi:cystathionine gamma-synthase